MFKLTPVKEVPNRNLYKKTKNQDILEAFIASDVPFAMYEGWSAMDAKSAAGSLQQSAKRYHLDVDVVARDNKVYLINNAIAGGKRNV